MVRHFGAAFALMCIFVLCIVNVAEGKAGISNFRLRLSGGSSSQAAVNVGDVLNVELFVEGQGEQITGVVAFIDIDDKSLELIPAFVSPGGEIRPFQQGLWMQGTVFLNGTLGESSAGNNIPLFNTVYHEDIPSGFGDQRAAVGDGVLATFQVRVIRKPVSATTSIFFVSTSPSGSESGYFKKGDPGSVYSFRNTTNLTLTVRGLELDVSLPDLYLLPGQVDSTLDLDDFVDDSTNPDSTLTWTNSVLDSMTVAVNPTTHRVLVDTRFVQGTETTNFIGIRQVQFSVTTRFDENANDNIRITVDTPVHFVDEANPDTVRYFEDRDTTFVLTAVDPDPGARVTFAPMDTLENIFAFIDVQSVDGDTIRQTVRLSAKENFFGADQMRFSAIDQFGRGDTLSVRFEVLSVNDPPKFVQAFADVEVGALGQAMVDLEPHVRDIDDPYHRLEFSFSGVDSIAFNVTTLNQQLIITPVPPFQGVRTATVVVIDTSNAAAVAQIIVRVLPPKDPQPPVVVVPEVKVGVRAGAEPSTTALDPLVNDIDTPDEQLVWTGTAESPIVLDAASLADRQLRISASADSTGYVPIILTVTDPTQFTDSLRVRVYSSSVVTGVPVAGGMPDLTIVVGTSGTLNLDDYYFDSDHSDDQVTWTAEGQRDVTVTIDPVTHQAIFTPSLTSTNVFEEIVFRVRDLDNKTATDTIQVTILDPGSVVLDLSVLGGQIGLGLGQADTLNFEPLLLLGNRDNIIWDASPRDPSVMFAQVTGIDLLMIGVRIGTTHLVVTATDTSSGKSATDSLLVEVGIIGGQADTLIVRDIGGLVLTANRDTTIDLAALVVAGNLASVVWSSAANANIAVDIDTLNQVAIMRPVSGFIGNAGSIIFLAIDESSGQTALSTASPIRVDRGAPLGTDLLKISVIINPVLKNFLDVFVRARRELLREPFLEFRSGEDPTAPSTPIAVNEVGQVESMWVGDLRLGAEMTGVVELSATGISSGTRVALADTLELQIALATVRSTFGLVHSDATVTLPVGGVDAASVVALIPERGEDARAKLAGSELVPVSNTYMVYAPNAKVQRPGFIAIEANETDRAGVYRWDTEFGRWLWMGNQQDGSRVGGSFDAFGRYGVFFDGVAPSFGDFEVANGRLTLEARDDGSGLGDVVAMVDGAQMETRIKDGAVTVNLTGVAEGRRFVRVEMVDLAGNSTIWERAIDFDRSVLAPRVSALHQNFPNPFNPQTTIQFDLAEATDIRLIVYSALGQSVRTLLAGYLDAGQHVITWDARDDFGRQVGAGLYLYRLEAPNFNRARKMLLLK